MPRHTSFENRLFQIILKNIFLKFSAGLWKLNTYSQKWYQRCIFRWSNALQCTLHIRACTLACPVVFQQCKQNRLKLLQKREIFKNRKLCCLVLYSTQHCAMLNVNVALSVIRSETFSPFCWIRMQLRYRVDSPLQQYIYVYSSTQHKRRKTEKYKPTGHRKQWNLKVHMRGNEWLLLNLHIFVKALFFNPPNWTSSVWLSSKNVVIRRAWNNCFFCPCAFLSFFTTGWKF